MSEQPSSLNAFSAEYLTALREKDEPHGVDLTVHGPLVLHEAGGRFLLFRPWQSPEAGDVAEADFETREEALLFVASRSALGQAQVYGFEESGGAAAGAGHAVAREGRAVGSLRSRNPEWLSAAHVLACLIRSPEDLAAVLEVAGPTVQEEVGQILGRSLLWETASQGG